MLFNVTVVGVHHLNTEIVNEIYYNPKGQRIKIKFENGATTTYEYDVNTFRVTRIRTTRTGESDALQDLKYWYDPVGNITTQEDAAQQTFYYDGSVADPANDYTYDALYRLLIAQGREHVSSSSTINAVTADDSIRMGYTPVVTDYTAMQRYIQYYTYDEVGNMLQMKHTTTGGAGNWTRNFTIDTGSNRLTASSIGSNGSSTESYTYDTRGNMASGMNHLNSMTYDAENRLIKVQTAGSIDTYYQYDSTGQRVRKTTLGSQEQVRIYVGGWELYRKMNTGTTSVILLRETLHIMDDQARVAMIDTPTRDTSSPPTGEVQLLRYQFSNHLGTASLELDASGAIISYEEYYPFGSTSYQSGRSTAEVSLKRYRYVGKERDEETGLYYIGARYYCPWLARWCATDPIYNESYNHSKGQPGRTHDMQFEELTCSSYEYCYANPVRFTDPSGEQVFIPAQTYGVSPTSPLQPTVPVPQNLDSLKNELNKQLFLNKLDDKLLDRRKEKSVEFVKGIVMKKTGLDKYKDMAGGIDIKKSIQNYAEDKFKKAVGDSTGQFLGAIKTLGNKNAQQGMNGNGSVNFDLVASANPALSLINESSKILIMGSADQVDQAMFSASVGSGYKAVHNMLQASLYGQKEHLNLTTAFVDQKTMDNIIARGGFIDFSSDNLFTSQNEYSKFDSPNSGNNGSTYTNMLIFNRDEKGTTNNFMSMKITPDEKRKSDAFDFSNIKR